MSFSTDFLWGGATSAHQCEGAWNVGGRGPGKRDYMIVDKETHQRMLTYVDRSGKRCLMPLGPSFLRGRAMRSLTTAIIQTTMGLIFTIIIRKT